MKLKPKNSFSFYEILNKVPEAYALQIQEAINIIAPGHDVNSLSFNQLPGGLSKSKVYRVDINNKKFVFRLLDANEPLERRLSEFHAHKIGADLRIAPMLFYVNSNPLVFVMEFIEGRSLSRQDLDNHKIITQIVHAIKRFHNQAPSNKLYQQTRTEMINCLYKNNQEKNGVIYPSCFEDLHKNLQAKSSNLKKNLMPTHGDLNLDNVLIANDGKIYFIDWAEAHVDNPFLDIGALACFTGANNNQIKKLLREYLGRIPNESEFKEVLFCHDIIIFHVATFWIGRQKQRCLDSLDILLAIPTPNTQPSVEDIPIIEAIGKEGLDLTTHALQWLKKFIVHQDLTDNNSKELNWLTHIKQTITRVKNQFNKFRLKKTKYPFVLILGVSGAGKTTIIQHLKALDSRITPITPYTTRPLRPQEIDKKSISIQELEYQAKLGRLCAVNHHCGFMYAAPRIPIENALCNEQIPVQDFSINKLNLMQNIFGERLFCVYIAPPNLETLKIRLDADGRDKKGVRFAYAQKELVLFNQGVFDHLTDKVIINYDDKAEQCAQEILEALSNRYK